MDLERKGEQSYQGEMYVRFLAFSNGDLESLYDHSDGFTADNLFFLSKRNRLTVRTILFLQTSSFRRSRGFFCGVWRACVGWSQTTISFPKAAAPRTTENRQGGMRTMCCCSCARRDTSVWKRTAPLPLLICTPSTAFGAVITPTSRWRHERSAWPWRNTQTNLVWNTTTTSQIPSENRSTAFGALKRWSRRWFCNWTQIYPSIYPIHPEKAVFRIDG